MVHEINDRVQIDGKPCTIRFIGEIHKWPGSIAYGVEWDDSKRGKNSGTIDDQVYFKTVVPNAGSFLKDTKWSLLSDSGVSFYEALQEKYGKPHNEGEDIYLGTKRVESFGFEKLAIEEQNLGNLQGICLDHCKISCLKNDIDRAPNNFFNISELDLSYNLLSDIKEICEFISCFRDLKFLDLSGNYFTKGWENLDQYSFPAVTILYLSNCRLDLYQLNKLLKTFPSVEILNVSKNYLRDVTDSVVQLSASTRELTLSGNSIRHLPRSLSNWNLHTLNLSHNAIQTASYSLRTDLKNLDLSYNLIDDWKTLDQLNIIFPELHSLRVNGNPFFENGEDHLAQFYLLIARVNNLDILNGSLLSKKEREEAKLFFVSQVSQGLVEYDKSSELWYRLHRQYAPNYDIKGIEKSWLGSQILNLRVKQEETQTTVDLTILSSYTIRNLKRIICEHLSMNILEITLCYYIAPSVLEEICQDFTPVSDLNLTNGDSIYVKRKRPEH
ncbi:hypothetical protein ZYGR_0AK04140 [Zygosaccharomyces rouxii]|uniref:CAP-Gly domain-containing protein n=1 Tax=Zygosaccharomyces rouxii TaxID=4956 RepID=A0A1Q3AE14_ZYGRO|nr:hypothetical protein ZYGR_0AK04140 [Zygosaccharomyces rouxii]